MKLIEADKVEQAIKDYWEAQVDKALTLTDGNEKRITIYLEHNHELLKAIEALPSAEPEAISKWKKEFREYVDSLDITRDDWKGIIEYIDELPSAEPDTTTHDSIHAETGKNDGVGTSGDCISRRRSVDTLRKMQTYKLFAGDDMLLIDQAEAQTELMMLPSVQPERKDAVEKAVAVEAISDELMSRFDISATYAYEIAEKAMNRIEAMAKELERGKQE